MFAFKIRQGHISAADSLDTFLNFFDFAGGERFVGVQKGFQIALGGMQIACRQMFCPGRHGDLLLTVKHVVRAVARRGRMHREDGTGIGPLSRVLAGCDPYPMLYSGRSTGLPNQMLSLLWCPRRYRTCLAVLPLIALLLPSLYAGISQVRLATAPSSPQPLGSAIQLTASATDSNAGPLTYKWELQLPGSSTFTLLRDFDVTKTLTWSPNYTEGKYLLRLTARDYLAGASAQEVVYFVATPLVAGDQAVAVPTANPLVALFSAPSCPAGSTMAVVFQAQGSQVSSTTDWRPCHPASMNFYIGGMRASQTYTMTYQVNTSGTITPGSPVSFTTGVIPSTLKFPARAVPLPPMPRADTAEPVVLTGYADPPDFPVATDLNANVIWYYPSIFRSIDPAGPRRNNARLAQRPGDRNRSMGAERYAAATRSRIRSGRQHRARNQLRSGL